MRALFVLPAALIFADCRPELAASGSLVSSTRILAVRADPPETAPGRAAVYRPLIALPDPLSPPRLDWWFCDEPKPLIENDVVGKDCLSRRALIAEGAAATVTATTPADACQKFGPDPPPGMLRPRDPDVTGGYYQPLVASRETEVAVVLERVLCNLAQAPADVAAAFRNTYAPNQNPRIGALTARAGGQEAALDHLPAGMPIDLSIDWDPASEESYVAYDLGSEALTMRRESLEVSWFTDQGAMSTARTAHGADATGTTSQNVWTPPKSGGPATIWIVLRDDRGGLDFATFAVTAAGP